MWTDLASIRPTVWQFFANLWSNWHQRRGRLIEFDNFDSAEIRRIAQDLGTSVSELRVLAGYNEDAADLLRRRLRSLNVDPAAVGPAVMRDLQRCCSQRANKTLCEHELEDQPKAANWLKYCPNEQTIDALVAERRR